MLTRASWTLSIIFQKIQNTLTSSAETSRLASRFIHMFLCVCVCVYILPYFSALSVQIACNTLSPVKTEKRKDIVETKRNSIKWVAPIFTVISVLTGWKTWGIRTFGRLITQVTLFQTDKKALEASSIFLLAGIYPSPILKGRKWCNDEKSLIFESKYKKDWLGCADWYKALRSAENVKFVMVGLYLINCSPVILVVTT